MMGSRGRELVIGTLKMSGRLLIAVSTLTLLAGCFGSEAPVEQSGPYADPSNTIILTVGLGYDTPADRTPKKTGEIAIQLDAKNAPTHAKRMKTLSRKGFYNGKVFHRVVEGFVAQTGSPKGDGIGGAPGYSDLKAELSDKKFERGVVGMARAAEMNSANSQFFIMYGRDFGLDGKYTVIGEVVRGMAVAEKLQRTRRFEAQGEAPLPDVVPDRIVRAEVASDRKTR